MTPNKTLRAALLLCAATGLVNASSTDASWDPPRSIGRHAFYRNGLAIASNGNSVHSVWYGDCARAAGNEICYRRSTDCGETWSKPVLLARDFLTSRLVIAASGSTVHVAWTSSRNQQQRVFYTGSPNGGQNWSMPRRLSPFRKFAAARSIAAAGDSVYLAYVVGGTRKQALRRTSVAIARSHDGGRSWISRSATPRKRNIGTPVLDIGPGRVSAAHRVHLAWSREGSTIWHQVSDDRARTWSNPELVHENPRDFGFVLPTDSTTLGGGFHVVWDRSLDNGIDVAYIGSVGGRFGTSPGRLSSVGISDYSWAQRAALAGAVGILHAVWDEHRISSPLEIWVARSGDRGETWTQPQRISGGTRKGIGPAAIAASDTATGNCRGSSHVVYRSIRRDLPTPPLFDITYRRWLSNSGDGK